MGVPWETQGSPGGPLEPLGTTWAQGPNSQLDSEAPWARDEWTIAPWALGPGDHCPLGPWGDCWVRFRIDVVLRLDIIGLAFTPNDSKLLVSLSGMPDSTITYWRWDLDKILACKEP